MHLLMTVPVCAWREIAMGSTVRRDGTVSMHVWMQSMIEFSDCWQSDVQPHHKSEQSHSLLFVDSHSDRSVSSLAHLGIHECLGVCATCWHEFDNGS